MVWVVGFTSVLQGLGFRVWGLGFKVQGLGVWDLGLWGLPDIGYNIALQAGGSSQVSGNPF